LIVDGRSKFTTPGIERTCLETYQEAWKYPC
jgi:hypothetical protein